MSVPESLLPTMHDVLRDVLEQMFFCEALPVQCRHCQNGIAARVRFDGEPSGELTVMLSRELAVAASAGFLAEDNEEVTASQLEQIACELANIICGAILSRLHPNARVGLSPPEIAAADFTAPVHQCFETSEGMLAVAIRMN